MSIDKINKLFNVVVRNNMDDPIQRNEAMNAIGIIQDLVSEIPNVEIVTPNTTHYNSGSNYTQLKSEKAEYIKKYTEAEQASREKDQVISDLNRKITSLEKEISSLKSNKKESKISSKEINTEEKPFTISKDDNFSWEEFPEIEDELCVSYVQDHEGTKRSALDWTKYISAATGYNYNSDGFVKQRLNNGSAPKSVVSLVSFEGKLTWAEVWTISTHLFKFKRAWKKEFFKRIDEENRNMGSPLDNIPQETIDAIRDTYKHEIVKLLSTKVNKVLKIIENSGEKGISRKDLTAEASADWDGGRKGIPDLISKNKIHSYTVDGMEHYIHTKFVTKN